MSPRSVGLLALLVALVSAYRVVQDDYSHADEELVSYFEPYHPGYVGIFGEPTNPRRWRVNEGNQFMNAKPNIYEDVHARRKSGCGSWGAFACARIPLLSG